MWNEIKDFAAPELDVYARTSEVQLLRYYEPEPGVFIAESPKVIERALHAGYQPVSFLVEHKDLEREAGEILKKYPDVRFDLYNEMADNIKDKLEKGLLDLGLLLEPVDTKKYEFLRLSQKESWGILLRKDHPLAEKDKIYVQDLREYPLILPKRENARNEVLNWLQCEESHLNIPVNYNLLSNVALLVEAGIGCAVCLDGALSVHCSPDICFCPVYPEHTTRSVLLWKKNHLFQPAASLFIQMLHTHKWGE